MAQGRGCADLEVGVESVKKGRSPEVGQCFGIGSSVELAPQVEVTLSKVSEGSRKIFQLGPGPTKLSFLRAPKGLAAVLERGRAIVSAFGETLGLRAERGPRFIEVWVNSTVELEVGAQGQVSVKKIEGEIRVERAVKLQIGESAGKSRRKPEDQYFDDVVDLPDEEFIYSLVEDAYLDVDDCLDYFEEQLRQDQRDGLGNEFLAEGFKNIGECYLIEGRWAEAIESLWEALEIDLELYGEIDPDVAEDYRALGDAYLEQGDLERAIEMFENARRIDEGRRRSEPEDWTAAADLAEDLYLLAEAWDWSGHAERARELERLADRYAEQAEDWESQYEPWEYEDDTWESPGESWESEDPEFESEFGEDGPP